MTGLAKIITAGKKAMTVAVRVIEDGGLVIIPTETFYGICADPFNNEAMQTLLEAKGRDAKKPISLIAGSMETAFSACGTAPERAELIADAFWPGPLTLILPADKTIPKTITAGTGTVGVRVPGPSFALELANAFSGLLTATSANRAGAPPPTVIDQLDPELINEVGLVIDGGPVPGGQPSTLLDLSVDPPRIIRDGVLGDEVREWLLGRG